MDDPTVKDPSVASDAPTQLASRPPLMMSGGGGVALPISLPKITGYDTQDYLGGGGMGDVFRAIQLGTRRTVALKIMRGSFASEKSRMRFDREVELMARLDHPHIARVYDSGLHQGVYFYAMELIEGAPLNEFVESRQLSQRERLELMRTVARAVEHAHLNGVIHRDLKPSNVMVTPDGQPHLLDFGLAKMVESGEPVLQISKDQEVVGTPAFMSPEQAAGDVQHVDRRTDVYSLGVMMFHLLTGQSPHDLTGRHDEVLRRITEDDVTRPRELNKDIDRELEAVLLKTLSREREDRYASAGDLAKDIDNYLNNEPLIARRPTIVYFLRKRIRKHALPLAIAAAIVIGLAVMAAMTFEWIVVLAGITLLLLTVIFAYIHIRHDRNQISVQRNRMERLLRINEAMNEQPDLPSLWGVILREATGLSDADGGSLFVRDGDTLEFVAAQNQTLAQRMGTEKASGLFQRSRLPISDASIAGYVARTGKLLNLRDVRSIHAKLPFHHDNAFDSRHDYSTRSVLAVPLKDPHGQVLGVLELINCKDGRGGVVPFPVENEALVTSMASLAAVALRYHQLKQIVPA